MLRPLFAGCLALLLALPLATSVDASPTQFTSFETRDELLDSTKRSETLDELKDLGIDTLRVVIYWKDIAPAPDSATQPAFDATDPAAYSQQAWAPYDGLLTDAKAKGLKILLNVSGPVPIWATSEKKDHITRPSAAEFERFMQAVGKRYAGKVDIWSIWNEPNWNTRLQPQYVNGKPASPQIYRELFLAADRALNATGNGNDPLLVGDTAPRGKTSGPKEKRRVPPLRFLREMLCLSNSYKPTKKCEKLPADGYAHHPYTGVRKLVDFKPPDRDDVSIGVLSRLVKALDRAAKAGAIKTKMGIYLTEFGVQSVPDKVQGVSLSKQAQYRSLAEKVAYDNPRVKSFAQYLMRDDKPRPSNNVYTRYSGFESGIRYANGKKKLAYDELRTPLVVKKKSAKKVSLWGLIRPAKGVAKLEVQVSKSGRSFKRLKRISTNSKGYWALSARFVKGARWRVVWKSPEGKTYTGPATDAQKIY